MQVTIKVSSWFKRYTDGKFQLEIEIEEGATVCDAVCRAGIPRSEIGFVSVEDSQKDRMEKRVDDNYKATEGCVIYVFPYIIGG